MSWYPRAKRHLAIQALLEALDRYHEAAEAYDRQSERKYLKILNMGDVHYTEFIMHCKGFPGLKPYSESICRRYDRLRGLKRLVSGDRYGLEDR